MLRDWRVLKESKRVQISMSYHILGSDVAVRYIEDTETLQYTL